MKIGGRKGKTTLVHRAAYEAYVGNIPDAMCVLHKCDVRSCFRPDHLFLGTNKNNSEDRELKGRGNQPFGVRQGCSILTDEAVLEIRRRCTAGEKRKSLAKEFDVALTTIRAAVVGITWRHLNERER